MTAPTPWSRFVMPWQYAIGVTGRVSPGDLLYFYVGTNTGPGTTTPKDTFADASLSQPNDNPLVADQRGIFRSQNGSGTADIFLASDVPYRVVWTDSTGNEILSTNPVSPFIPTDPNVGSIGSLEMTVDGGTGVPLTGICGDLCIPFAFTITAGVVQATLPGDLELDVWANQFVTNTPPTVTDSIVASAPLTLGSSQSSFDSTLTGWTKTFPAQTALRFNLNSISTITRFTASLQISRA